MKIKKHIMKYNLIDRLRSELFIVYNDKSLNLDLTAP